MAKKTVNIGANANDSSGDAVRTAFGKLNSNSDEIYNKFGDGDNLYGVGTATNQLMQVGAFGIGGHGQIGSVNPSLSPEDTEFGLRAYSSVSSNLGIPENVSYQSVSLLSLKSWDLALTSSACSQIAFAGARMFIRGGLFSANSNWDGFFEVRTTKNTTVDGNGYLKPSSPVVRLYADKIEAINEAIGKDITFEKLGVGNYLVKNTTGLRDDDGWYIETPRDNNGNILVFVEFTQLENKDISVKTYKKKFDIDTASIVADHDNPMDIPTDRWIDLRFNDYPVTEQQPTSEATV